MHQTIISTDRAPAAIGPYSQAVRIGNLVFLSGQIPLDPDTMSLVADDFQTQAEQVFRNLSAVCEAAGGRMKHLVKVNIYLTDLDNFAAVNEIMAQHFDAPYPARAAVGVAQLPKGALIEIEAVLAIG